MQGVLKPSLQPARDGYSQITSLGSDTYDGTMTHHPQQKSYSTAWPGIVSTSPYYQSTAPYATPSAQQPYATPVQPSSASQPNSYNTYYLNGNPYTYSGQSPPAARGHDGVPTPEVPSEEPATPNSAQKWDRQLHGRVIATAKDLEELAALLQAEIDAACVNGVHGQTSTEISLSESAFVPLLRPLIGPYADGGGQDLPDEFKQNFLDEAAASGAARESQENSPNQDQSQDTARDESQEDSQETEPEPSQQVSQDQTEQDGDNSQTQQTPSKPGKPKNEDPLKKCPRAAVSSVLGIQDAKIRSIVQRAASRGLVQRITNLDGFKYMFNNFWTSHVDNDSMRFSYICRDSYQNKDRAAHVPARASTVPAVHSRQMLRQGKATWDCKGSVSIKFSSTAGVIIVQYRHAAIHPTHAERKPPPRKPRNPVRGVGRPRGSHGMKRKRDSDLGPSTDYMEASVPTPAHFSSRMQQPTQREPSLFELLQHSAAEMAASGSGGQLGSTSSPWWANS